MATTKKRVGKTGSEPTAKKTAAQPGTFRPALPPSVVRVRDQLGLSRKLFSRLAGFSERAIADWEGGKPVSEPGLRRIRELDRFRDRLSEVVAAEMIPAWLDTPNEAFGGLKPLEVIERGEIDRLWNMIFYLESGVAS
jgi:DNA-binding transcriptional regulator YiaG